MIAWTRTAPGMCGSRSWTLTPSTRLTSARRTRGRRNLFGWGSDFAMPRPLFPGPWTWCCGTLPGILCWPSWTMSWFWVRTLWTTWPTYAVCFPASRKFDLKFKPKKCALCRRRVEFLGRQVSPQGVEMGDSYVEAVRDWAAPSSTKDVERFLGFANCHRGIIAGYAQLAFPLYRLTRVDQIHIRLVQHFSISFQAYFHWT